MQGTKDSPNSLHQATIEIFEALNATSHYNTPYLVQSGLIKTLCTNFEAFKITDDSEFDSVFG